MSPAEGGAKWGEISSRPSLTRVVVERGAKATLLGVARAVLAANTQKEGKRETLKRRQQLPRFSTYPTQRHFCFHPRKCSQYRWQFQLSFQPGEAMSKQLPENGSPMDTKPVWVPEIPPVQASFFPFSCRPSLADDSLTKEEEEEDSALLFLPTMGKKNGGKEEGDRKRKSQHGGGIGGRRDGGLSVSQKPGLVSLLRPPPPLPPSLVFFAPVEILRARWTKEERKRRREGDRFCQPMVVVGWRWVSGLWSLSPMPARKDREKIRLCLRKWFFWQVETKVFFPQTLANPRRERNCLFGPQQQQQQPSYGKFLRFAKRPSSAV